MAKYLRETLINLQSGDLDLVSLYEYIKQEINSRGNVAAGDYDLFRSGKARRALVLYKASGGAGDPIILSDVAAALELLRLGLLKHFSAKAARYGLPPENTRLVLADAYYARALGIVVALGDTTLVRILCDALASASEGYAGPDNEESRSLRNSLEKAAFTIGCYISGRQEGEKSSFMTIVEEVDSAVFAHPS